MPERWRGPGARDSGAVSAGVPGGAVQARQVIPHRVDEATDSLGRIPASVAAVRAQLQVQEQCQQIEGYEEQPVDRLDPMDQTLDQGLRAYDR